VPAGDEHSQTKRTYARATWLFLRLLGLVYLFAFWSLGDQIIGLVGEHGIMPARPYLAGAAEALSGFERFWRLPTVAWLNAGDTWLRLYCIVGAALSVLLVTGTLSAVVVPILWFLYLSLSVVCRDFLLYQWDALLLEAGLLAIFVAPISLRERFREPMDADPPRLAVWLLLWLTFRMMVGSGAVKLTSGDPTWRNLTALAFHFETQPIPTPLASYAHHLPLWFLKASTLSVFAIELMTPFLMFGPRRLRALAFTLLVGFQALLALTGNYGFFNLLTAGLCVFLLDDTAWRFPRGRVAKTGPLRRAVLVAVAVGTVPVSAVMFAGTLGLRVPGSGVIAPVERHIRPFRSVNAYGLFAVMTTDRFEIIVEGSDDSTIWREYEFAYKVGDVRRRPPWVAPHQPRLDWQMWFAALSQFDDEPWFRAFLIRLLEADPDVLRLLERDPFGGRRPRYIRAVLYRYRWSTGDERRQGIWWTRERLNAYSPILSLDIRANQR
jgi:hypothetical protein